MVQARLYRVSGQVQGVGFRWFVRREAAALELEGYVKNLHDGRVEVLGIGTEDKLTSLKALLERGPSGARVENITEEETAVPKRYLGGFSIAH